MSIIMPQFELISLVIFSLSFRAFFFKKKSQHITLVSRLVLIVNLRRGFPFDKKGGSPISPCATSHIGNSLRKTAVYFSDNMLHLGPLN